jgi:HSP20 family protein
MFGGGSGGGGNGNGDDIEKMFQRMMGPMSGGNGFSSSSYSFGNGGISSSSRGAWAPSLNIRQTPTTYVLTADAAGVRREDMDVNVSASRVCLSGVRVTEVEEKLQQQQQRDDQMPSKVGGRFAQDESGWLMRERPEGRFERCVTLPSRIDEATVRADYVNGVLEVVMSKFGSDTAASGNVTIN